MTGIPVAVLGAGEIGSRVASELAAGAVHGATLGAVVTRRPPGDSPWPLSTLVGALKHCGIVVECAGQQAVADHGLDVIGAARTLVVTSAGALADLEFRRRLSAGPGRWVLTSGALGGLDTLGSASRCDNFDSVSITTTKAPHALRQPWMGEVELGELMSCTSPIELFAGSVGDAAKKFPASMNVATSVALASQNDDVLVTVRADPGAGRTRHEVHARHPLGEYSFEVSNEPSRSRPSTSAVVAHSVTRTLQVLVEPNGMVV